MVLRLVAVDLDGTLLGGTAGRYGFLPAGVEALRQAAAEGATVVINTGRDLPFIVGLLEREGVHPAREGWPQVIVSEERYIHTLGTDGRYEADDGWNEAAHAAERSQFVLIVKGVSALLSDRLTAIDAKAYRVEGEVERQRGFVEVRFSSADAARACEPAIAEWLAAQSLPYATVRNVAGIAVRHESVGKGPVLREVCRRLGIAPADALAVGDSCNDLSMLDGGFGFAAAVPGNGEPEVKERARAAGGYIAEGCFGEGVAEAVRRFGAG